MMDKTSRTLILEELTSKLIRMDYSGPRFFLLMDPDSSPSHSLLNPYPLALIKGTKKERLLSTCVQGALIFNLHL